MNGRPSQRTAAVDADTATGTHPVYSRKGEREAHEELDAFDESAASAASRDAELPEASPSIREPVAAAHVPADAADHPAAVAHDDPLAHAFFERASEDEIHDDAYVIHHLSRGSRRAMFASLGIFVVSVVSIGSYAVYQNFVMPAPAELGASLADIPAVPQPEPQNIAPASSRWAAVDRAPRRVSLEDAEGVKPSAAGTETQLSAATDPVHFDVQGSAKAQLRGNGQLAANGQPATNGQTGANGKPATNAQLATNGQAATNAQLAANGRAATNAQLAANGQAATKAQHAANGQPPANTQLAADAHPPANEQRPVASAAAAQGAIADPTHAEPAAAAEAQPATSLAAAAAETPKPAETKPEPVQFASAAEPTRPSGGLPTANSGPTYDELVAVGRALSKKNRRVEASEAFRRALLQSPQGSAALSGLGYVYLNADEKQNAREYAQRAVQADASNAEGWIVLGAALEMLGDRAGARDAYRKCVERGQGPYLLECRRVAR